jgi:hypothetical protein
MHMVQAPEGEFSNHLHKGRHAAKLRSKRRISFLILSELAEGAALPGKNTDFFSRETAAEGHPGETMAGTLHSFRHGPG